MKTKSRRKWLALFMALVMLISTVSVTAFAEKQTLTGVTAEEDVGPTEPQNDANVITASESNATSTTTISSEDPGSSNLETVVATAPNSSKKEEISVQSDSDAEPVHWDISKSKEATNLDSNFESQITLSLPSSEENLISDVVFVMDDSQCKNGSAAAAKEMVNQLLQQKELTGAKLKVGMIIFGGTAIVTRELSEVSEADDLETAINNATIDGLHGSNIQSGLIEADNMLSSDTEVADSRKYVVLISDGHTYQFSKEGNYSDDYRVGDTSFKGLTTFGIYSETDLYAYAYGITYTLHGLHDQYYTGDYSENGDYKGGGMEAT